MQDVVSRGIASSKCSSGESAQAWVLGVWAGPVLCDPGVLDCSLLICMSVNIVLSWAMLKLSTVGWVLFI